MSAPKAITLFLLAGLCLVAIGYLSLYEKVEMAMLVVLFVPFIILVIKKPRLAIMAFVFVLYTNLAVIAKTLYGVPEIVAASFSLVLAVPIYVYVVKKGQKLIFDPVMALMIVFVTVLLASSVNSRNPTLALMWILGFIVEGLVLYFLVVNAIRERKALNQAILTLLVACSLLGFLSLFQEVTNTYTNSYGGLAQKNKDEEDIEAFQKEFGGKAGLLEERDKVRGANRAGGPIGKPNRYAQIMLIVLPLAVFKFWGESTKKHRIYSLIAASLILCGVLLSYSRGGFLTMAIMVMLLTFLRYIRPAQLLKSVSILIVIMVLAAPGYFARLDTLRGIEALFSEDAEVKADGPTRGRLTEMLAALLCFFDHPVLGVGPGLYTPYYSKDYQDNDDIMFRQLGRARRSHILYFELAAETGIIGFSAFMGMIAYILMQLWKLRKASFLTRPDIANLSTAFCFALIAYMGTSIFLHMSYQRYYWFILALAGAAVRIFREELQREQMEDMEATTDPKALVAPT